ncbi:MAG: phosphate acetyltransferase [Candidatus Melainabacteria bacterium]|nr:phosphate acetyltransferase [Candidatus Melainabacteria bacterium]
MFLDSMKKRVLGAGERIVYPEGAEERAIRAADLLQRENFATPILLGKESTITAKAQSLDIEISHIKILDPEASDDLDEFANTYCELRKHKGMTLTNALTKIKLPHYFGAMMVRMGKADGMVSGLNSETKPFIPAFEIIQLKKGFRKASSLFVLEWPERLLFFADCSFNIDPDAETLADIAHATAQTVKSFGYDPRIAFLSFSTRDSAKNPLVDKVKEATRLTKELCPGTVIDGEVQFDAALLPDVAKKKAPDSPFVELGANVFIFPNLDCGNIAYKITERLGRATATGPILQGLNHPINDVSRGCSFEDFANVGILTAALAHMQKQTVS